MTVKDGCGTVVRELRRRPGAWAPLAGVSAALLMSLLPVAAQASMFKGETLDKVADVLAIVVMVLVPLVGIAAFLFVHVLPEKIAEKRHHPQAAAIKTLCFLSLAFGGLLWPIAWLWAYTKPVSYRLAYGTDKHESYYVEMAAKAARGELDAAQLQHLREELDAIAGRGALTEQQRNLRHVIATASPAAPPMAKTGGAA